MAEFVAAQERILQVIGAIGSVASVVALLFAWLTLRRVQAYERTYTRQAVLPTYIENLTGYLKNLERARNDKSSRRIRIHAANCRSTLVSLAPLVDRRLRRQIGKAVKVTNFLVDNQNELATFVEVEVAISQIHGVLRSVQNFQLELPWRRRND